MKYLYSFFDCLKTFVDWILSIIDALFNKHKLVRRTIVFWAMALVSWSIIIVLPKLEGVTAKDALVIIIGLLTVVIGFYKYLRDKDND